MKEYIHGDSLNSSFWLADSLRISGLYSEAIDSYRSITGLSDLEKYYLNDQIVFCQLQLDDLSPRNYDSSGRVNKIFRGDLYLNIGLIQKKKGSFDSSISYLKKSIRHFTSFYGKLHYKSLQSRFELAKVYRYHTLEYDSTYRLLHDIAKTVEESPYLKYAIWPAIALLIDQCRINRDYIQGLTIANDYLSFLEEENLPVGRHFFEAEILRAKLISNTGRPLEALEVFEKVFHELNQMNEGEVKKQLLSQLYNEILISSSFHSMDSVFEKYFAKLVTLSQRYGLSDDISINRLKGRYHFGKNEYSKAIEFISKAIPQYDKALDKRRLYYEGYFILGECYNATGDFEQSRKNAYNSLTYGTSLAGSDFTWQNVFSKKLITVKNNFINYGQIAEGFLNDYCSSNEGIDKLYKALELYELIDSITLRTTRAIEEDALLNFLNEASDMYNNALNTCYLILSETGDRNYIRKAYKFFERSKALLLFREILINDEQYFPRVPDSVKVRGKILKKNIADFKRQGILNGSIDLIELINQQEDYFEYLEQNYPRYFSAMYNQQIVPFDSTITYVRNHKNEIVYYHWGNKYLFTLLLSEDPSFFRTDIDSVLDFSVNQYKRIVRSSRSILDINSYQQYLEKSSLLFEILMPFYGELKYDKLTFILSDRLSDFSFESLITRPINFSHVDYKNLNYLINEKFVDYGQSFRTHAASSEEIKLSRSSKIVGYAYGTEVELPFDSQLSPLSHAVEEVERLARRTYNEQSKFRFGKEANTDNFINDLKEGADVFHIATHAQSSTIDRFQNKIVLNSTSDKNEVDEVYANELISMNIQAQLVVLSACESAVGVEKKGEGTFSLARAFNQSGVPVVISTLWRISDKSSSDLMELFYEQLLTGIPPIEALGRAKRMYIKRGDLLVSHPYFWSALVCNLN